VQKASGGKDSKMKNIKNKTFLLILVIKTSRIFISLSTEEIKGRK
jgi:hypothetical protein